MEMRGPTNISTEMGKHAMIQVNWMAVTTVVAIGALLTALLTYVVATVGRSTHHRPAVDARHDGARSSDFGGSTADRRRTAA